MTGRESFIIGQSKQWLRPNNYFSQFCFAEWQTCKLNCLLLITTYQWDTEWRRHKTAKTNTASNRGGVADRQRKTMSMMRQQETLKPCLFIKSFKWRCLFFSCKMNSRRGHGLVHVLRADSPKLQEINRKTKEIYVLLRYLPSPYKNGGICDHRKKLIHFNSSLSRITVHITVDNLHSLGTIFYCSFFPLKKLSPWKLSMTLFSVLSRV